MFEPARASKLVFRLAAALMAASALSACSSVPDWVDPTTWVSSSSDEPDTTATDNPSSDQTGPEGKTVAEASDKYPALADTPDKAPPTTSTDEQKEVSNGLVADRSQAQYSAEALRGGTEAAAAPPPPPGSEPAMPPPPASESTATASATPPPSQTAAAAPQTSSAMPGTLPSEAPPPPQQQVASATAPVTATAAPPAPAAAPPPAASYGPQMNPSDAALGFQPSHAPPLDPGVAQLISPSTRPHGRQVAVLAPASMSMAPAPIPSANGPAAAAVMFTQDATVLTDAARAQVRTAVDAFKAKGGQGYVRVVGHSSAGGKLAPERKMVVDLERSQARANAVARELIKQGVPASKVLVEAAGDTRSGADGERRADIFVQS
jgi:outer membrane protein OmpA-like peptidoglycan-associated protein